MKDTSVKALLGMALREKDTIGRIVGRLRPEDIENGILVIDERVFNEDLRPFIMGLSDLRLTGYKISFASDAIFLDAVLNHKKIGEIRGKYMLEIKEFLFDETGHRITFRYQEDVKFANGLLAQLLLKAAGLSGGNLLQTALGMAKVPWASADKTTLYLNLDKLNAFQKYKLDWLRLNYSECRDNKLKFLFTVGD